MSKLTPETVKNAILATYKQGQQSVNENGFCMYRGPNGLKCVVGHMIPDEKYKASFESAGGGQGSELDSPHQIELREVLGVKETDWEFALLGSLQNCHDKPGLENLDFKSKFRINIRNLAKHPAYKSMPEFFPTEEDFNKVDQNDSSN